MIHDIHYLARQRSGELMQAARQERLIAESRRSRVRAGKPPDSRAMPHDEAPASVAEPAHSTIDPQSAAQPARRNPLIGLALDIGLPLVAYYALHAFGASDWLALLTATAAAGARLIWVAISKRRLTWFSVIMLGVFGIGFALAFVGGDPRVLLIKDSAGTATIGVTFLASLLGENPLTLSAAQTWKPHQAAELDVLYRREPAARRAFRVSAFGWGVGLLAESLLRIPLVWLLPIHWAVGLSTAWMITAMAVLTIWNIGYMLHAAHHAPELRPLLPGTPSTSGI